MKVLILFLTLNQANYNGISLFYTGERIGIRLEDTRIYDLGPWYKDNHFMMPLTFEHEDYLVRNYIYFPKWNLKQVKQKLEISKKLNKR